MDKIDELLTRGVANIIPGKDLLRKALEDKKLNVYLGIDPTSPRIHLGHAVSLIKLSKFVELGHNVTLLIGDFTALVGDTSDKETERPILTVEEIQNNFKTYKSQAEKFLDFSKVKIRRNSKWLSKLSYAELIHLKRQFSLNDFISRELIRKRLDAGKTIRLDETEYPIMQGYDSYFMDTDLQIGGTDQTFNMQVGRTLQKRLRNKESYILATEFLMGTDGRKMSKTWNNAIWISDNANDMYAKIMSINDDLIIPYFILVTRVSNEEIKEIKKELEKEKNPINIKKRLAFEITREIHGEKEARRSEDNFKIKIQAKEKVSVWDSGSVNITSSFASGASVASAIVEIGLTSSKSEAERLISQGGISINRQRISDPKQPIMDFFKENKEIEVKRGKLKARNVKIK